LEVWTRRVATPFPVTKISTDEIVSGPFLFLTAASGGWIQLLGQSGYRRDGVAHWRLVWPRTRHQERPEANDEV